MNEEFSWLKPRNLIGIATAMKQADTFTEREQLKRLMYRGVTEWAFIIAFFVALIMGFVVIDDGAGFIVANVPQ